jgi:hypothetical protein
MRYRSEFLSIYELPNRLREMWPGIIDMDNHFSLTSCSQKLSYFYTECDWYSTGRSTSTSWAGRWSNGNQVNSIRQSVLIYGSWSYAIGFVGVLGIMELDLLMLIRKVGPCFVNGYNILSTLMWIDCIRFKTIFEAVTWGFFDPLRGCEKLICSVLFCISFYWPNDNELSASE